MTRSSCGLAAIRGSSMESISSLTNKHATLFSGPKAAPDAGPESGSDVTSPVAPRRPRSWLVRRLADPRAAPRCERAPSARAVVRPSRCGRELARPSRRCCAPPRRRVVAAPGRGPSGRSTRCRRALGEAGVEAAGRPGPPRTPRPGRTRAPRPRRRGRRAAYEADHPDRRGRRSAGQSGWQASTAAASASRTPIQPGPLSIQAASTMSPSSRRQRAGDAGEVVVVDRTRRAPAAARRRRAGRRARR